MADRDRPAAYEDFGTQLARFQGGAIILHGYGCPSCGHGFWVEDDTQRAVDPSSLRCPRCGGTIRPEVIEPMIERATAAIVATHDEELRAALAGDVPANTWRPERYADAAVRAALEVPDGQ